MAEGDQKKSSRQAIARLQQRVKAALLAKSLPQKTGDKLSEWLDEISKQAVDAEGYRAGGSNDLAENLERKVGQGLDNIEQELGDEEGAEEEPEEEGGEGEGEGGGEGGEEGPRQNRQKKKGEKDRESSAEHVQDVANRIRKAQQRAKVIQQRAEQAKKTAETARKTGLALKVITKSPHFWVVVLIIILTIGVIGYFGGLGHKVSNEGGGSFAIEMDYDNEKDQVLAGEVMRLKNSGALVFADGLEKDIEWKEKDDKTYMDLDWRVMVTLKYLGEKWEKRSNGVIGISLSTSNGPDTTRRGAAVKIAGVALADQREEPLDAPSAYATGQAIGINQIGRVSNALAKECFKDNDGKADNNAPVEVKWQEIASQHLIRPTYEQLQVDGKIVYEGSATLNGIAQKAKKDLAYRNHTESIVTDPETWFVKTGNALDLMIFNLTSMSSVDLEGGTDVRTAAYAKSALMKLKTVREKTRDKVVEWDDDELMQKLHDGLRMTFRMMQIANVVGWSGSTKNSCRLWKAYEARRNIRQLVLDLEQMPADLSLVAVGTDWNSDLMVRQLIVYSPEDDLDNGLPSLDVFPRGAVAVDEGGVGFDDTGKDNVVDEKDWHFMDLPIDNGVFSKASTIFVYTEGNWLKRASRIALDTTLTAVSLGGYAALDAMHDAFNGAGVSLFSGEKTEKATYKNFVHIGF